MNPPDELLWKLDRENPQWTVEDWEVWWCKWGRKRWVGWKDMKVCDKCNCERNPIH